MGTSLSLTEFFESARPKYAILSHRWGTEEFTFEDLRDGTGRGKAGYKKIQLCGKQAGLDGLKYFWVDTCCIDKSSSAELSEAINSMFEWYKQSSFCYAYLSDVAVDSFSETFRGSRWFKRGWTLQELIAPETVRFFDMAWTDLGSKTDLCGMIASITSIAENVLLNPEALPYHSIAQRMSWAAGRETTRPEDTAYSLLGIFRIHMPFYGERTGAFIRLQEEIIKTSADDSILAWGLDNQPPKTLDLPEEVTGELQGSYTTSLGLLAKSPEDFKNCGMVQYNVQPSSAYTMSNFGLEIQLPCASGYRWEENEGDEAEDQAEEGLTEDVGGVGLLRCTGSNGTEFLGILLSPFENGSRCMRVVTRPSQHATVLVNARVASRAVTQSITINHGRDWEIEESSPYSPGQATYIFVNNLPCLPVEVLEVCSYSLESPWGKNDHTWDPVSQIITTQLQISSHSVLEGYEKLFIIEYQVCASQLSDFKVDPARFFIVLWRGKALIRTTQLFSSSDYEELKKLPYDRWRKVPDIGKFSIEMFEAMAESVTVWMEHTRLEMTVSVKKRKVLKSVFFVLGLGLKDSILAIHSDDGAGSAEHSHMLVDQ